ncbi:hypothetical protein COOONC_09610 [Cooperia oncophora]
MTRCWDKDPNERPNFTQCIHQLKEHLRLASPQLLERVELDLGEECKRQDALAQWLDTGARPTRRHKRFWHCKSVLTKAY